MKALYFLLAGCIIFSSCTKNSEGVIKQTVTPVYPVITLKGDPALAISIGSTYTDPGATAFDSLANSTTTLTPLVNPVDPKTPGVYFVNFQAINKWGYRTQATRLVLVTSTPASDDISGTYKRTSNSAVVHITKLATGLYSVDNLGGVAAGNNPVFFFPYVIGLTDLNTLVGPNQPTPLGGIFLDKTSIDRSGGTVTLKWAIEAPQGFGNSVRTFVKQ
ncbi:immunoglobulin-like domain-containing protein [Chitinophaga sp. 212800010-3]|uniref:immunoglobulin-like domain-containing protein n=1 Tax=unclassified Chitinophaga TaxID=2619133 RepID=UPI002DE82D78|nr:DUF5011 domain-containing protein [Chitinophaga sp. 212800010-3]